jgi:hypothetical protein
MGGLFLLLPGVEDFGVLEVLVTLLDLLGLVGRALSATFFELSLAFANFVVLAISEAPFSLASSAALTDSLYSVIAISLALRAFFNSAIS